MTDSIVTRHESVTKWADLDFPTLLDRLLHAIDECRKEGAEPTRDPAVRLIADRLGRVVDVTEKNRFHLIRTCEEAVNDYRAQPLLMQILSRPVVYDETRKPAFHKEAKRLLRQLAARLSLRPGAYDIRSNRAGPAVSGEVTLHGEEVYLQVSQSSGLGDVMYRRCQGRKDYTSGHNHFASAADLCDPPKFADRIAQELRLGRD